MNDDKTKAVLMESVADKCSIDVKQQLSRRRVLASNGLSTQGLVEAAVGMTLHVSCVRASVWHEKELHKGCQPGRRWTWGFADQSVGGV